MMKKTLIIGLILCSLLIVTACSFVTADETKEIIDREGDVLILNDIYDIDDLSDISDFGTTNDKPNIDIVKVTYSRTSESKRATVTLEVKGVIEDSGYTETDPENFFEPMISYNIALETSNSYYAISYMNGECDVNSETENIEYNKDGSVLSVTFDLDAIDETYVDISGATVYLLVSMTDDLEYYVDMAPDLVFLKVTANADQYNAKVGERIDFTGSAEDGISPYNYSWDFDDGVTSFDQNPTHIFNEPGTYEVILLVTDGEENIGTDSLTITISDESGNNGGNGNSNNNDGDSSDSNFMMFIILIAIIAVVGVISIIVIIRR